jgi:hypothetical protein
MAFIAALWLLGEPVQEPPPPAPPPAAVETGNQSNSGEASWANEGF